MKRKCFGCNEVKELNSENWAWKNKEHTEFRTRCRKCTNFDSKISHRIRRSKIKQLKEEKRHLKEVDVNE